MLSRIVDIRRGEAARVLLAFAMLLLVIGSYTVVKSVRDAVFLSKFGVTQLSFIAIGLAFLTSFVVSAYLRVTGGLARNVLISGTYFTVAGSLVGIWLLLAGGMSWVPWLLYIWSSIFGVFTVMQFWLLANDLFDSREAKRLFGFIGAGAILGGVSGGFASRWLAKVIGTNSLLLVAGGMLVVAALLANIVWPLRRIEPVKKKKASSTGKAEPEKRGFAVVRENRYVLTIAMALLLSTLATTLLDWQFKAITKNYFAGRTDEMAGFFGSLYAWLSVASFVLQAFVTGPLLRRFGVGVGLLILPSSLLLGSSAILLYPLLPLTSLQAASGAKVAEGGLRFAIDKASMELMWMPVPPKVKEQGKAFVDTVVDRFGTGITGLLWLGLAAAGITSPQRVHFISILVLVSIVAWIAVLLRARRGYVDAFRDTLATRTLDAAALTSGMMDAGAKESVRRALDSDDAREVGFGLYMLREMGESKLPPLDSALAHDEANVRVEALRLLRDVDDDSQRAAAVPCLTHEAPDVREAAVQYLIATAPSGRDTVVEQLASDSAEARFAVSVIKLARSATAISAADDVRAELAKASSADEREGMIRLLGGAPPAMAAALLAPLLEQASSAAAAEAAGDASAEIGDEDGVAVDAALRAAGRAKAEGLIPQLIALLDDRRWRPRASEALREIGAPALDALSEVAASAPAEHALEVRLAATRLLGSGDARYAQRLLGLLDAPDPRLSYVALRALVRMRGRLGDDGELPIDAADVNKRVNAALTTVYRDLVALEGGSWPDVRAADPPDTLLERTLRERAGTELSRAFSLLSLTHGVDDIRAAENGTRSPLKSIRASSIEFLDNVLERDIKAVMLPLLEGAEPDAFAATAKRVIGVEPEQREALLSRLLDGRSPWLRAVACWTSGDEGREALRERVTALAEGGDGDGEGGFELAAVAARALAALDRAGDGDSEDKEQAEKSEETMALTVIEKALKLQTVDVLRRASSEDLAHVAQIAQEVELEPDTEIYAEGADADALFVVISGSVKLLRGKDEIGTVGEGEAFGTWALFDDAPRVAAARASQKTLLLKVDRDEFLELLADRVDIVQAVFKAMVARLRQLADVVQSAV